jgi:arylsulfatase A-like enzyme
MKRLFWPLALFCGSTLAAEKPNLLVILADDLGRGEYSTFGTRDIRTPHIDRLCREGMTFDNFYMSAYK